MKELDELKAIEELFGALEQGEVSARENGYISLAESRRTVREVKSDCKETNAVIAG